MSIHTKPHSKKIKTNKKASATTAKRFVALHKLPSPISEAVSVTLQKKKVRTQKPLTTTAKRFVALHKLPSPISEAVSVTLQKKKVRTQKPLTTTAKRFVALHKLPSPISEAASVTLYKEKVCTKKSRHKYRLTFDEKCSDFARVRRFTAVKRMQSGKMWAFIGKRQTLCRLREDKLTNLSLYCRWGKEAQKLPYLLFSAPQSCTQVLRGAENKALAGFLRGTRPTKKHKQKNVSQPHDLFARQRG